MNVHFVNLTRGLLCPCAPADPHYLRIQSTRLEQKAFELVIREIGPDFLMHLALGAEVVVHDVSERPRTTRALWQGLPWVRFVCERTWAGVALTAPLMRNGHNAAGYFEEQYRALSDGTVRWVGYFGQFWNGRPLEYALCPGRLVAVAA